MTSIDPVPSNGTVSFISRLHRKNLHSEVLFQESSNVTSLLDRKKRLVKLLVERHKDESGIIYCSTKKVGLAARNLPLVLIIYHFYRRLRRCTRLVSSVAVL